MAMNLFNPREIAILCGVFTAIYFPMMVSLPLTIDAEFRMLNGHFEAFIGHGRWANYLLSKYLLPPIVVPYFSIAFFGLMAAISYKLMVKSCEIEFSNTSILGFAVFIGIPTWSYLLEFVILAPVSGIALLAVATSVYLLSGNYEISTRRWPMIGLAVVLTACATGVYQSFILVFVVLSICVASLNQSFDNDGKRTGFLLVAAVVSLLALCLYFLIHNLALWFVEQETAYIVNYFRPDLILAQPLAVANDTLHQMGLIYRGTEKAFGAILLPIPLILVFAVIGLCMNRQSSLLALLIIASLAPFALVAMAGGLIPYRTLIGVGPVLWLAFMLAARSSAVWLRYGVTAIALVLILQSTALISQYQAQRILTDRFEQNLASEIYIRISEHADLNSPQSVDFFGARPGPRIYPIGFTSSVNGSFFEWDRGNPDRMITYMSLLGYDNLKQVSKVRRLELKPQFEQMPVWPAKESVKRVDDVVLIKLGDQPGHYHPVRR